MANIKNGYSECLFSPNKHIKKNGLSALLKILTVAIQW